MAPHIILNLDMARFYAKTFPDSSVGAVYHAPSDYPSGKAGDVLTVGTQTWWGRIAGPVDAEAPLGGAAQHRAEHGLLLGAQVGGPRASGPEPYVRPSWQVNP